MPASLAEVTVRSVGAGACTAAAAAAVTWFDQGLFDSVQGDVDLL